MALNLNIEPDFDLTKVLFLGKVRINRVRRTRNRLADFIFRFEEFSRIFKKNPLQKWRILGGT